MQNYNNELSTLYEEFENLKNDKTLDEAKEVEEFNEKIKSTLEESQEINLNDAQLKIVEILSDTGEVKDLGQIENTMEKILQVLSDAAENQNPDESQEGNSQDCHHLYY